MDEVQAPTLGQDFGRIPFLFPFDLDALAGGRRLNESSRVFEASTHSLGQRGENSQRT